MKGAASVVVRPRRQVTLPAELCDALGIEVGDALEIESTGEGLILRPRRSVAARALREIQEAFATSGISEDELQAEGRRVREEMFRARYGH